MLRRGACIGLAQSGRTRRLLAMTMTSGMRTYSNGTSISVFFSSHSGTGRFFDRMNSGLNSFD